MAQYLAAGIVALLASDSLIQIVPREYAEFQGTAAQLCAEGLIPDGFEWPTADKRVSFEDEKFSYWIGRQRPADLKGPKSAWVNGDYWFLRRRLTAHKGESCRIANIYEKTIALVKALEQGTPEHMRLILNARNALQDEKYMEFRHQVVGEQKRRRGRPAKVSTQVKGASA